MKTRIVLSLLVSIGCLILFNFVNGHPGAAAPALVTYTLGVPEVAATHSAAIDIVGWLPEGPLMLMLHEGQRSHVAYFAPDTGELAPAKEFTSWREALQTVGRASLPDPHVSDPPALPFLAAQWSPDGRIRAAILAPGAQAGTPLPASRLQLFDSSTGQVTAWENAPRFITDLAWAPDSRWLAVLGVAGVADNGAERAQLFLVDAHTGKAYPAREETFGGGMWGRQLAWSPDGTWLAIACPTATEGRVCLLPARYGELRTPPAATLMDTGPSMLDPAPTPVRSTLVYTPPAEITLHVYQLTLGGARRQPYTLCEPGSTAWGCTVFCDETDFPCVRTVTHPYPYAANPITISIESDYLLDVVPLEMGTYYHATALIAQAAAARSYAYRVIYDGRAVNNSTAFQAFIPYKFESLPTASFPDNPENPCAASNLNARQHTICDAVAPGYYIAYDSTPEEYIPAFAEFSADAWLQTVNGGRIYLRGVEDPISSGCDANDYGHQRGMSQEGASRWARGNRCSYSGAGNDPWSIRWDDARQILTHYYTGIQLRDSAGTRLTPDYRWAPLEIDWRSGSVSPPLLQPAETRLVTFTVQNTGVLTWTGQVALTYHGWETESGAPIITTTTRVTIAQMVAPGASIRVGVPLTAPLQTEALQRYRLRFDMQLDEGSAEPVNFSTREPERPWPVYETEITVMLLPHKMFIPLILRGATG
ncbi:MAG: hypothetical protein JW892_01045 [Anaerolineae bacterium]|nr:hypothetical protein [Anaerolineae bacterium]